MSKENVKTFDIIIFGASGHIGRYVVEELAISARNSSVKWAVAGRSLSKLKETLTQVQSYLEEGITIQDIPVIYADTEDPKSLYDMCKSAKLILNCVGPYNQFAGELIVANCIECGTHHIDLSAELKYLETVQVKYFELAREKKVYILEACGFGSLPADYAISLLRQRFPGGLNAVEYFIKIGEGPSGRTTNAGTFNSLIHSFRDDLFPSKYDELLKQLFKKPIPVSDYPLSNRWPPLFYSHEMKDLCVKYIGPDSRVLKRSEMFRLEYLNEKSVQSKGYFQLPPLPKIALYLIILITCYFFSLFSMGRKLLCKYPSFFTAGEFTTNGPSRQQVLEGSTKITFFGTGWENVPKTNTKPDSKVKLTITGPEPAYPFTAICMVQAGLVLLEETDKLPLEGGVLTPGVAFEHTTLQERLENRGIKFHFETEV